jgi:hypothetical protein
MLEPYRISSAVGEDCMPASFFYSTGFRPAEEGEEELESGI